jgi:guanylate kinase
MLTTIIFVGPSAVGKTYIAEQLIKNYPSTFEQAKLYTTRQQRAGEIPTDRIFVTEEEFESMVQDGGFLTDSEFGGCRYGFTKNSIYPTDKHLLLNAWPWQSIEYSKLDHVLLVGMQAPINWGKLLRNRMKDRGDSSDSIAKRISLIEKDIKDMENNRSFISKSGKYFTIENNETITVEILPFIIERLGL